MSFDTGRYYDIDGVEHYWLESELHWKNDEEEENSGLT